MLSQTEFPNAAVRAKEAASTFRQLTSPAVRISRADYSRAGTEQYPGKLQKRITAELQEIQTLLLIH